MPDLPGDAARLVRRRARQLSGCATVLVTNDRDEALHIRR
jgi:hypothetical protein